MSQSFTNRNSNLGGHVNQREAMDLNPKRGRMKRKFIKSSFKMPLLEMIRKPLTFQVTCFRILVECYGLESLNRNLLGPNTAKEKGTANSHALVRAANTDWLLWVFWEMMRPTIGRHIFEGVVSINDSI
jgi:hypothetical protein